MAKLNILVGKRIGKISVLKRVENFEGKSDSRSQYLIKCDICHKESKVVGRDLVRHKLKFKEGCCFFKNPKRKFKYGRNKNGFIDKSIIIYE